MREEADSREESKEKVGKGFRAPPVWIDASAPPAAHRIWFSMFVFCQVALVHFVLSEKPNKRAKPAGPPSRETGVTFLEVSVPL